MVLYLLVYYLGFSLIGIIGGKFYVLWGWFGVVVLVMVCMVCVFGMVVWFWWCVLLLLGVKC